MKSARQPGIGRILFFVCLNDRGGAELSSVALAQGLLRAGRDVRMAVYGRHPELARALGFEGSVLDLDARRSWAALLPLARLLRRGEVDAVIAALTHTNFIAVAAAWIARLWGGDSVPVLASEHGLDGIDACVRSRLFALVARWAYGQAAAVVCVSQGLAQAWRAVLSAAARVVTIYNPVLGDDSFNRRPPGHPWLEPGQPPVVIGVGRLKEEKNFALLIRAFSRVAASSPVRLILLGEGEQRPMLEALARDCGVPDRVSMPGFVADKAAWLPYAALFVCPSKREGFGNALVEALAYGVPVVSCDCPYGPAEILENGRYGRLVPPDDEAAMAQAMLASLQEGALGAEARIARARVFSVMRCIDAYEGLVDNQPSCL